MKFWQITVAVLIFKAFDASLQAANAITSSKAPIIVFFTGMIIWLILSFFAWGFFQRFGDELERAAGKRNERRDD